MKKKFLSLLMAFCLMLSLAPAAFAVDSQPETITLPNGEVIAIPNLSDYEAELAARPASLDDTDILLPDEDGVYHITSESDFLKVPDSAWYQGNTFELESNLNLALLDTPSEWNGYIRFFKGTLNGNGHTISGIANNRYFIYAMIGGQIDNLTIQLGGQAGALIFAPGNDNKTPVETKLTGLTATGEVYLSSADQSNYSPFIYCSGYGGLTMSYCTNKAEINGNIYGGIFYGYYPLFVTYNGEPIKYVFDHCSNEADVTMKYASMFFGNPSTIENKLTAGTLDVTITNCSNTNEIRGTVSSHYFAPSLSGAALTGNILENEEAIQSEDSTNSLPADKLTVGEDPAGFTYSIGGDGTITINAPTNRTDVSYYLVAVSSYCYLYSDLDGIDESKRYGGTDRYSVVERIDADDLATYGVTLKYYGIADADYGQAGTGVMCINKANELTTYATRTANGSTYYVLTQLSERMDGLYYRYAMLGNEGTPVSGCNSPSFVDVTAFDGNGNVVGFAKEATT